MIKTRKNNLFSLDVYPGVYSMDFSKLWNAMPNKRPTNTKEHYNCNVGYIVGFSSERQFFKSLVCGREWCNVCGQDYSIAHQRRIARLSPYIRTLKTVGYLVITIPARARNEFKDKGNLNKVRDYWRRKFKRENIPRGAFRYHWAGDDNTTYKPHLNILIPKGWIKKKTLKKWKTEFETWFFENFQIKGASNIYYNYTSNPAKIHHLVKYITRATYKAKDDEIKETIRGYKNTIRFGTWRKEIDPESELENLLSAQIDLVNGSPIDWISQVFEKHIIDPILVNKNFKYFDGGIYARKITDLVARSRPNQTRHLEGLYLDLLFAEERKETDLTKKGRQKSQNQKKYFAKLCKLDAWNLYYCSLPLDYKFEPDPDPENNLDFIKNNTAREDIGTFKTNLSFHKSIFYNN